MIFLKYTQYSELWYLVYNYYVCCRGSEKNYSDHDERLVGNPIYGGSHGQPTAGENSISERENYNIFHHNVGTGTTGHGVNPIGAYEMISIISPQSLIETFKHYRQMVLLLMPN